MKPWYKPYFELYERDINTVPADVIQQVKVHLKRFKEENPIVSLVVIAYNEQERILSCLWSLSHQICNVPMELIVVNNNSKDKTEEVLKMLDIDYYNELKQGPGYARQCGLDKAKGKFIICIDADTMYPVHYVSTHLKALQQKGVSCACSLWSFLPRQGQSTISLALYEGLRDLYLRMQFVKRPELCVRGMVFSFCTNFARQEGFRTDIKRGEDGSLALALKKYGRIAFIGSRKARAVTGYGTLNAEGSLSNSFIYRLKKAFKGMPGLFVGKTAYQDEQSNMINKSK